MDEQIFVFSLHTNVVRAGDDQSKSECAYQNYARVVVTRAEMSNKSRDPVNQKIELSFPECVGGRETATYSGVSSGDGKILYAADISPMTISTGATPHLLLDPLLIKSQVNAMMEKTAQ